MRYSEGKTEKSETTLEIISHALGKLSYKERCFVFEVLDVLDQRPLQIPRDDLEKLMNFWSERSVHHPVEKVRHHADAVANTLNLIWKSLFGPEGFTIKEWTRMQGPDGVFDD